MTDRGGFDAKKECGARQHGAAHSGGWLDRCICARLQRAYAAGIEAAAGHLESKAERIRIGSAAGPTKKQRLTVLAREIRALLPSGKEPGRG